MLDRDFKAKWKRENGKREKKFELWIVITECWNSVIKKYQVLSGKKGNGIFLVRDCDKNFIVWTLQQSNKTFWVRIEKVMLSFGKNSW